MAAVRRGVMSFFDMAAFRTFQFFFTTCRTGRRNSYRPLISVVACRPGYRVIRCFTGASENKNRTDYHAKPDKSLYKQSCVISPDRETVTFCFHTLPPNCFVVSFGHVVLLYHIIFVKETTNITVCLINQIIYLCIGIIKQEISFLHIPARKSAANPFG